MKRLLYVIITLLLSSTVHSQVAKTYFRKGNALSNILKKDLADIKSILYNLPPVDLEMLQKEDDILDECDVPYRFGKVIDVSYTLDDGVWQDYENGRIWSITFKSSKAVSLNFILKDFYIPSGGELYIVDKEQKVLYGPVCQDNIGGKKIF